MKTYLVDNGSLRAESYRNLCRVAAELTRQGPLPVDPAPLLHASRIPPEQLDGVQALTWERRLKRDYETGERDFLILPFFFGPTGAIVDYMQRRVAALRSKGLRFRLRQAPFLYDEAAPVAEDLLVRILAERVRNVIREQRLGQPPVALVDHGSPKREVTAVRNALAPKLASVLGEEVRTVRPCSMERRDGEAYAFNDPLLAALLDEPGFAEGDVVVSMLFLSPGRHAGPGGDVASIIAAAQARHPGLRGHRTELVGTHPLIVPLLAARLHRALAAPVLV